MDELDRLRQENDALKHEVKTLESDLETIQRIDSEMFEENKLLKLFVAFFAQKIAWKDLEKYVDKQALATLILGDKYD